MSVDPQTGIPVKARGRSRASNAPARFVEAGGRSIWARRFQDIHATYLVHLGHPPSPAELSLIRRVCTLECELERQEGLAADDVEKLNVEMYARVASQLRRLLEVIGIQSPKSIEHQANPLLGHFQRPVTQVSA